MKRLPFVPLLLAVALPFGAFAQSPAAEGQQHLLYLPQNSTDVDHLAIIQAFEKEGFVVSTYTYAGEDAYTYARRIANEIRTLTRQGVDPSDISVMGSGSGMTSTLLASAVTGNRHVSYVVLGGCDRALKNYNHIRLSGNVIALRDAGDSGSQSCRPLFTGSPRLSARKDLKLDTSYGAALFNTARAEWTGPASQWMRQGKVDIGEVNIAMLTP